MDLNSVKLRKLCSKAFLGSVFGCVAALCGASAIAGPAPAPTPRSGLGGNHNYAISTNCTPLRDLKIIMHVSQGINGGVSSPKGYGKVSVNFQLNAWSLAVKNSRPLVNWQQYMLGISVNGNYGNTPMHPYVNPAIQNWLISGGVVLNAGSKLVSVPGFGAVLPSGYTLIIALHNDRKGNVTGATFTSIDPSGVLRSQRIDLKNISTFSPRYLAPIVGFELNLVGSSFTSGAGTITYSASTPMTVSNHEPSCVDSGAITAESTNSVYGVLPPGPSTSFTQTFRAVQPTLRPRVPGAHVPFTPPTP